MRVFLVAGEPSGDRLGAAFLAGLRSLRPDLAVAGVGGEAMAQEGLRSLFPMAELSVMGLAEVLPRLPHLLRRRSEAAAAAVAFRPDVLLTIDSPDFGLRVAARVRAAAPGVRRVHYVAPSVWAWRPKRAARMARVIDHVLALLPFEPPYMEAAGMACDFVGHPAAAEPVATAEEARAFRAAFGLGAAPVVLLLPGSRAGEVARLMPVLGAAAARVAAARPGARFVLPAAGPVAAQVRAALSGWPVKPLLLSPRADPLGLSTKRAAFRAADAALAASGTVSLELAAAGTPMVIAYDMAWLTALVMARMLRTGTVTLVNLVSGTRAVPEFLGPACRPGPIADAVLHLLDRPEAQAEALRVTMDRLGRGGEAPGLRAARAVVERWEAARAR